MKKSKEEERSPIILVLSIFVMLLIYFIFAEYIVKPIRIRYQQNEYYEYIYVDIYDRCDI